MSETLSRVVNWRYLEPIFGICRESAYQRMNPEHPSYDPEFPTPCTPPGKKRLWIEADVDRYLSVLAERAQKRKGAICER